MATYGLLLLAAVTVLPAQAPVTQGSRPAVHEFYGTVRAVHGMQLILELRNGRALTIDAREAIADNDSVVLTPTRAVEVRAIATAHGLRAIAILKSHETPRDWPPDS